MCLHRNPGVFALGLSLSLVPLAATTSVAQERTTACPPSVENMPPPEDPEPPLVAGAISGAKQPERIPDLVALRLFLRSLTVHPLDPKQGAASDATVVVTRDYETHVFRMLDFNESERAALQTVVREFAARIEVLDERAARIKDRAWPDPEPDAIAALGRLQDEQDDLLREIMRSLPDRLGPRPAARLSAHVNRYVKRHIIMTPGPSGPPGQRAQSYAGEAK